MHKSGLGGRQSRRMPFLDRQSVFGADLMVALAGVGVQKDTSGRLRYGKSRLGSRTYRAGMAPIKQYHF